MQLTTLHLRAVILAAACALVHCGGRSDPDAAAHDALVEHAIDAIDSPRDNVADAGLDAVDAGLPVDGPDNGFVSEPGSDAISLDASCGASGDPCAGPGDCCTGTCSASLGVCLAGACGVAGTACTTPASCCSANCVAGACLAVGVATLDDDRDRVLETLSLVRHDAGRCPTWSALDNIQKGVFLTHSDMLGNRTCMENASITSATVGSSGNCGLTNACRCPAGSDMALAHVFRLWTVNGNDPSCSCSEGSDGYNCCNGGGEWHRTFLSADDLLIDHFRRMSGALPEWGPSTDLAGPHAPFDTSSETIVGQPRGQVQFWSTDSRATTLTRTGVNGVFDPHVVEFDQDYNILHDSNPEGCYGFFGLGCTYGRIQYRGLWIGNGNQALTTLRGNGEPSSHSELAGDPIYVPRCPTARIDTVTAPSIRRGAVITIRGSGFIDCASHLGCGNVIHVRTRGGEMVIAAGSPFDLYESATEIRVQIPAESGTGEAYVWAVDGGVLSNLWPTTVAP